MGCSSHKKGSNNYREDVRAESSVEGAQKFYYTDLQIVSETKPIGECADEKKLTERVEQEPKVMLNDANELDGPGAFHHYVANVSMQVMGFDLSKYVFTALDGYVPKEVPFKIRLRRLPGLILELQILDQTVSMKLRDTPVYSFTANETRGECKIEHHINVFGEHTGFYKPAVH
jgi:hypothetical protein